jgi:uncharacterized membrane protein (Fun14 family)
MASGLTAFFAGLLWLQVQKIVMVNWKVLESQTLESQTSSSLGWIANGTITNESSKPGAILGESTKI